MNHLQLARFFGIILLLIGCTARQEPDEAVGPDSPRWKFPDLAQEPLAPAVSLTADYFRKSYPHLTEAEFQQKWLNSQKGGLLFMRSFVNTWYDELSRISHRGPVGPCLGDPHPENFGYLVFAENFEYTFNDFDDSGACPVIFDALRYFTTLKMVVKDQALEAELRRAYIGFLNGAEWNDKLSPKLSPEPAAVLSQLLKKNTRKGKIKIEGDGKALSPEKAQALFALLPNCPNCKLLDAVQLQVRSGGSSGLDRYWLLVETASQGQQLLELKELTEPASQRGPWAQQNKRTRTQIIEEIWGRNWPSYFSFVSVEGKPFLLRTRWSAELELADLNAEQKKAVLTEQVYLLAQLHKKTVSGNTLFEEWLGRQSEFQARRYGEALLGAQGS
jgi:hypothetical protein